VTRDTLQAANKSYGK